MHKAIAKIVEYCIKFDIIINETKTQWMKIGDLVRETSEGVPVVVPAEESENFEITGKLIEKVDRFKLLGVRTMSNGSNRIHTMKRIQAAYATISGLDELGLNDPKIDPKVIGTLVGTYVRPRLLYGIEALDLNTQEERDLIMTEAKIIKRAMKIPYNCYNTELYHIIGIKPLYWAMKKPF